MRLFLYLLLGALLTPAVMLAALGKPSLRVGWFKRFFPFHLRRKASEGAAPLVWIHAASLGEWNAALPLVKALKRDVPDALLLGTANTDSGFGVLKHHRALFRFVSPFGFDTPLFLLWVFLVLKADAVILLEKELWPGLIALAAWRKVPVLVANARMAEEQVEKTKRLFRFFPVLAQHPWFFCRHDRDMLFWKKAGVALSKQWVVGDLKLDVLSENEPVMLAPWESQWLSEAPTLTAASLHEDEAEVVLDGFVRLLNQVPDCRLVVAPRHFDWLENLEAGIRRRGFVSRRYSQGEQGPADAEVLLLDTLGRLTAYFAHSELTVMGGTLGASGRGHNLLEPVWHGSPVLFGKRLSNWTEWGMLLDKAQVGSRIETADDLAVIGAIAIEKRTEVRAKLVTARQELRQGFGASRRIAQAVQRLLRGELPE